MGGVAAQLGGVTVLRFSRCCRSAKGAIAAVRRGAPGARRRARRRSRARRRGRGRRRRCRRRCGNRAGGRAGLGGGLDADAVPFPFGGEVGRVERRRDRPRRARGRASPGGTAWRRPATGLRAGAVQPGEERDVGRREAVPELLDLGDVAAAEVGERLLGEPGGDADAQAAGDELQERVAARWRRAGRAGARRPAAPRGARRRAARPRPRRAAGRRRRRSGAGQISATVSARSPT